MTTQKQSPTEGDRSIKCGRAKCRMNTRVHRILSTTSPEASPEGAKYVSPARKRWGASEERPSPVGTAPQLPRTFKGCRVSRLATLLALAIAMTLFSVACSKGKLEEAAVPVTAATVQKATIQRVVEADAVLFPLQQAAIVPKITAPVKEFKVIRGSKVHQGQLLAVLENKDLAAAKEENKGAFEQAEAAYVTSTAASLPEEVQKATSDAQFAKEQFDAEQKVYDSRQELFKQGALPRKDMDQSRVALTQARAQYELAKRHLDSLNAVVKQQELKSFQGQLSSAKGKYMGAQAQYSYSEIRSPIDGVVTDRPLYPGEMPAAGVPLITVMDISRVTARAHIPQRDAATLKVGDDATIEVPGLDKPVEGKVTLVSPALDPNSTTVEVWVQAKNPKETLKPGSSVRVSMVSEAVPDALIVPAVSALTGADGATTVMVIGSDQKAHQTAVKVGIKQEDNVQILEGLKEGQIVVAAGAYGLPDNSKVSVETKEKETEKGNDKPPASEEPAKKDSTKGEKE
jgi:HlyD family secretion protein